MINKMLKGISFSFLLLSAVTVSAAENSEVDAKLQEVKKLLKSKFKAEPTAITLSPLANVYEVSYGTEIVYFSADAKYFISGDLIETDTRKNISELAKTSVRKELLQKQDYQPVVFKAKNEKHKITVFTDIDCGYCAKLHREMPQINAKGITVEYLMFPRAGLKSQSFTKAVSMWCADDNKKSMTDAKARLPIADKTCENPIAMQYNLGKDIGVTGTPAIVTSTGKLIPGYMPANRLAVALDAELN